MSEYIYDDKFMNWAKGVLTLRIVKDGMFDSINSTMKSLEDVLRNKHGSSHLESFLKNLMVDDVHKDSSHFGTIKEKYRNRKISFPCEACTNMAGLLIDYIDDGNKKVKWKCHDPSISPDICWWILSKFYIPNDIKASRGPNDVDAQAVFKLMTSCKLFADVKCNVLTLLDWRNKLIHSSENMLPTGRLTKMFEDAENLLRHTRIKSTLSSRNALTEISKLKSKQFIGISIDTESHMVIKEALAVKKRSIEDDIEASKSDGIAVDKLQELLSQTTAYIAKEEKLTQNHASKIRDDIETLRKRAEEAEKIADREKSRADREEGRADSEKSRADREKSRADREERRADSEKSRADSEKSRADREKRRADGLDRKLIEENRPFLASVAAGATVGGTTGTLAGPVGTVIGGGLGAVAGGLTSLWNNW